MKLLISEKAKVKPLRHMNMFNVQGHTLHLMKIQNFSAERGLEGKLF